MNVFGDSDFESLSETSSDDQDDIFSLYSGHAQSILSSLEDSIGKIDDFLSFERGFTYGDIVCSADDPSGQMGKIVNVNMSVNLENVYGDVAKDVNTNKLVRMRSISVGDYVIHGPWLGRVDRVIDSIGIVFDDGSKCEILATGQEKLVLVSPNLLDDSLYPYHPGQRVKVGRSSGSISAGWLCGMSKKNQDEGTICSVAVGLVYVDWLASAMVGLSATVPPPPCFQDLKDLTLLSCFPHASWQLGEWCILPLSEEKANIFNVKEHKKFDRRLCERNISWKVLEMFSIVRKRTKLDVMWQDGTLSLGLESGSLLPVTVVNTHDFFPEQFVLEKNNCEDLNVSTTRRWGVVRGVDATERTVNIVWKTAPVDACDVDEEQIEETVSAYELVEHPDFCFGLSDIVFKLDKKVARSDEMDGLRSKGHSIDSHETWLSSIGSVTGFKDGNIEVQWANGLTTKIAPYEIFRMEKDDGSTDHAFLEGSVTNLNHDMVEHETEPLDQKEKGLLQNSAVAGNCQQFDGSTSFLGFPQAAVGFFTNIAVNLLGSSSSSIVSQPIPHALGVDDLQIDNHNGQEVESCKMVVPPRVVSDVAESGSLDSVKIVELASENADFSSLSSHGDARHFKQFDLVGDCSDHHFVDGLDKGLVLPQVERYWLKKVHQEWSILKQDLPETIYVRIYEERMDLLRAAIVGAAGTPYHDGIFFFDMYLPPDYPIEPPWVHYHSGGLRLNPNLYESGKVCLSLLNTWTGSGSEVWNPGSSSILQIVLSLQALVLNDKPYFNEAGYDKHIGRVEGEKNSVSYNENAFLVTCKSMLYILRKPPKHFEGLVEEHFHSRSQQILSACKAYMEGVPIGSSFGYGKAQGEQEKGNSTGFKIMLAKLFPKLVEAFSEKGIDCSQFVQPRR